MIIVISGPTASGKTDLSVKLAGIIGAEIINCDSRQIYKFMDIGTAKPGIDHFSSVKHHLFDVIYPDEYFNAVMYMEMAREVAGRLDREKKDIILTGGSGFYIQAFLHGLSHLPEIEDRTKALVADRLAATHTRELYDEMQAIDPLYAESIDLNDRYRIRRFYEMFYTVKCPVTDYFKNNPPRPVDIPYIYFYLERERGFLYASIDRRVDEMMEKGLKTEVDVLLERGYHKSLPSMNTIGYAEIIRMLEGGYSYDDTVGLIKQNTRNFAKRQIIWFRKIKEKISICDINGIKYYLKEFNGVKI